jgi:predicted ribosome quality control (RQC) complex YloA/Tae2 family protein
MAPQGGSPADIRRTEEDGWEILFGRTARDNDSLTFRIARPNDVWMHAAGHAGAHVVVRGGAAEETAPRHVVERAARIAVYHSKAREARGKVAVHICRAGDVRKRPGAPAGQVEIRRFDVLRVYAPEADPAA